MEVSVSQSVGAGGVRQASIWGSIDLHVTLRPTQDAERVSAPAVRPDRVRKFRTNDIDACIPEGHNANASPRKTDARLP